jgi:hypothetical protein
MHLKSSGQDVDAVFNPRIGCERHRWYRSALIEWSPPQVPDECVAVFVWHPNVSDDHLGTPAIEDPESLARRCRDAHLGARSDQDRLNQLIGIRFIVTSWLIRPPHVAGAGGARGDAISNFCARDALSRLSPARLRDVARREPAG